MQVLFHVSSILKLYVNFFQNFELYHILTYTSLLVLIQPNLQTEDDHWTIETCLVLNLKLLSIS